MNPDAGSSPTTEGSVFEFGPFRLDARAHLLTRDAEPIPLKPKVFETLLVLLQNAGRVVRKEELMRALWPDAVVAEANLTQNVWAIRKALEETDEGRKYVETVPRVGYRFVAPVRTVSGEAAAVPPLRPEPAARKKRVLAPVAGALVLAGTLAIVLVRGRSSPPAPSVWPRRSVAVMGFKNLSGRSDAAWLSTAFSEMLGVELAAGEKLHVIPGESVARAKLDLSVPESDDFRKETLERIRKSLGPDLVVLGSYIHLGKDAGGRIRLDVRLQDTVSGETIALLTETGTEPELFELVSRAGSHIRETLRLGTLSGAEFRDLRASRPSSSEGARLYAEGLERLRRLDARGAREALEKAIEKDPSFALAHTALSAAWSSLGYVTKARDEAQRALALSGDFSREERLKIEARAHEAAQEWDDAIRLDTSLATFFSDDVDYGLRLAASLTAAGRPKDALAAVDRLRKLAPPAGVDPRIDLADAAASNALTDYARGETSARKAAERAAAIGARQLGGVARLREGWAAMKLGKLDEAGKAIGEGRRLARETGDVASLGYASLLSGNLGFYGGRLEEARAAYEESARTYESIGDEGAAGDPLHNVGNVLWQKGDFEGALRTFEKARDVYRRVGDKRGLARATYGVGLVHQSSGELDGARKAFSEALSIRREVGEKAGVAECLHGLGNVAADSGDLGEAQRLYGESLAISREIGNKLWSAYALKGLGDALSDSARLPAAVERYTEALALCREIGNETMEANVLSSWAELEAKEGDGAAARRRNEAALAIRRRLGEEETILESRMNLASVSVDEGRYREAEKELAQVAEALAALRAPERAVRARSLLVSALIADDRTTDARQALAKAKGLLKGSGNPIDQLEFALYEARIRTRSAPGEALAALERLRPEAHATAYPELELDVDLARAEAMRASGRSD
ncbi:MAG TPA: tetratricopeptide repeat protein, partial [Thermoanaerobaculia bacterium]|nr:tetratricopeptide repeat protein [Thermoanaerobaculia bacterium]